MRLSAKRREQSKCEVFQWLALENGAVLSVRNSAHDSSTCGSQQQAKMAAIALNYL